MYTLSTDIQLAIIVAVVAMVMAFVRDMKHRNSIAKARRTLHAFAREAHRNRRPDVSAAYDNASHIVGLVLQRGYDVEPAREQDVKTWPTTLRDEP